MANKPLKIISLPVDDGGCGWYRVRQPFEAIKEYTDADTHVIDRVHDDPIAIAEAMTQADILVCRQGSELGIDQIKTVTNEYAQETGKQPFHAKVVLDIDDNIEIISPYSQHYKEYGVREYKDIWKDGKDGFNIVHNRRRLLDLQHGLRKVDMISVTTEKLADYARQFNPNVAVLPNVINPHVWWKPEFKPNETLRVGWSGGVSHYEDWETLKEPLNRLMRKYQFKLVLVGSAFTGLIDKDLHHLVEVWPWVPFQAHSYRMMLMHLDMAIIPLADLPFNHYKSSIKLLEMSAMGVPSLVANVLPYSKSGIRAALYYDGPTDFERQFEDLLKKPDHRQSLGEMAMQEVEDNWTTVQRAQTYMNAYRSLLDS